MRIMTTNNLREAWRESSVHEVHYLYDVAKRRTNVADA